MRPYYSKIHSCGASYPRRFKNSGFSKQLDRAFCDGWTSRKAPF